VVSPNYQFPGLNGEFSKQQTLISHLLHSGSSMQPNHTSSIPTDRYDFYESNKSGFTQKEFVVIYV
jgi:hypothetical protein